MKFYTNDGGSYEGMDESTIIRLRSELGYSTIFVDYNTYLAFINSH